MQSDLSERQVQIIRTTIQLIAQEGVQNFSIRKLAKMVGVTEPAIYRHFTNKDDLMIKLATFIAQNWHELLSELTIETQPLVDQTRIIYEEVMNYLEENHEFAKTLLSTNLFSTDSGMTGVLVKLKNDGVVRFAQLLSTGQTTGEIREGIDPAHVSRIFFGSVWWVVTEWVSSEFSGKLIDRWRPVWTELERLIR